MFLRAVVLVVVAGWAAGGAGTDTDVAKEVERLQIPAKIMPPKGKALFLLRAEGVQIYKGVKKNGVLQWVLDAPKADLFDYQTGKKVGTHSKGPIWVSSKGSKVEGELAAKVPAPNPHAVDWLLLETKGDGGDGRFGKVTYIARVDTWGGRPPATPPEKAGATAEVRYQATYVFFGNP
jgi:hypothetical protein